MGNEGSRQVKYGEKLENDVKINWEKLPETATTNLYGRDGHSSCTVNNKLYIFGGIVPERAIQSGSLESNELLVIDLENGSCEEVKVSGAVPPPRSAATMAAVGTCIYLFGGLSRETGWFDTVHMFDTVSSSWSLIEAQGIAPSSRDKLASATIANNIYIFGGFGPQGMEDDEEEVDDEDEDEDEDAGGAQFGWFNDLYVFNTDTKTFSQPMQMNLGCPTPRAAHGMCSVGKYLVIFGGRDAEARRNDLHIFDTESRKWQTDVLVQGRQPEPRSFHSVTAVNDRVVIMGGRGVSDKHFQDFHIFDTTARHWVQPEITGCAPSARGLHTAAVVGDRLAVFGGSGNYSAETMQCSDYHKDIYTIPTANILSGESHLPEGLSATETCEQSEATSTKRALDSENISSSDNVEKSIGNGTESPSKKQKTEESESV